MPKTKNDEKQKNYIIIKVENKNSHAKALETPLLIAHARFTKSKQSVNEILQLLVTHEIAHSVRWVDTRTADHYAMLRELELPKHNIAILEPTHPVFKHTKTPTKGA